MPYADGWNITRTRVAFGVYDCTRLGQTVRVTCNQTYATESINAAAALFLAIQALGYLDEGASLPVLWNLRYRYAVARWKLVAYDAMMAALPGNQRAPLKAKRDQWVILEGQWRTELGSDA